jgi:streptogramin lyase
MQNSKLYRVDPDTAEVTSWKVPVEYANPYDTADDDADNMWLATDNHVLMFDQKSQAFTLYPVTVRTDIPRLTLARDGAVWFTPRHAGQSAGYGAVATVLYPDKDKIKTLKPAYSGKSYFGRHLTKYKGGVVVKPEGKYKYVKAAPENPGEYDAMLKAMGLPPRALRAPIKTGADGIQ